MHICLPPFVILGFRGVIILSCYLRHFRRSCYGVLLLQPTVFLEGGKHFNSVQALLFFLFSLFTFFFLLFFRVILFDRSSQRRTLLSPLLMNRSFTEDSLPPSLNINHLFMRFRYKSSVLASTLPILKSRTPSPPRLSSQTHKIKSHPL